MFVHWLSLGFLVCTACSSASISKTTQTAQTIPGLLDKDVYVVVTLTETATVVYKKESHGKEIKIQPQAFVFVNEQSHFQTTQTTTVTETANNTENLFVKHGPGSLFLVLAKQTFDEAAGTCREYGGHLAVISEHNAQEANNLILSYVSEEESDCWVMPALPHLPGNVFKTGSCNCNIHAIYEEHPETRLFFLCQKYP